jgi:PAS domain S-box-containing protein
MDKTLRLLMLEDSERDAALILRELTRQGYEPIFERVETADAMSAALEKPWDIIIADFILPGFSGLEALKLLQGKGLDIPCIITSGRIDDETAVSAMRSGAKDYIMKDNLKRLGPAIERELYEAHLRHEGKKTQEALRQNEIRMERQKVFNDAILKLFWEVSSKERYLEKAVILIRNWCGCDCVGIRIVDADTQVLPYIACDGFSEEFKQKEGILSLKHDQCCCIRAITNRPEPSDSAIRLTSGSFYLCNSADFVQQLGPDQLSKYRGLCIQLGYQTIAIIPIRHDESILGVIHILAKRAEALSFKDIETLETISAIIGQSIYRFDMEEQIRASERRLAEAQSIAHLGNWDWHILTNKLFWSDETCRIFGLAPHEFRATYDAFLSLVHPDDREFVQKSIAEALAREKPYSIDHRIILKDGSVHYVHEQAETSFDREGKPVCMVGTVQDITDMKRIEEELRALSRRLVEAQENERRTIARELHDEIGQSLTALKMIMVQAARLPEKESAAALNEGKTVVSDLMRKVREMSLNLRPSMLDDLGLLPTLIWHFERFTAQTGIRINFEHEGLRSDHIKLAPEVNTAAYRIVQEALTNIARHAEVDQVDINIELSDNTLSVRIEDRGRGFSPAKLNANASTGLSGMRERVRLLEGRLHIVSAPGKGTRITAELPAHILMSS